MRVLIPDVDVLDSDLNVIDDLGDQPSHVPILLVLLLIELHLEEFCEGAHILIEDLLLLLKGLLVYVLPLVWVLRTHHQHQCLQYYLHW